MGCSLTGDLVDDVYPGVRQECGGRHLVYATGSGCLRISSEAACTASISATPCADGFVCILFEEGKGLGGMELQGGLHALKSMVSLIIHADRCRLGMGLLGDPLVTFQIWLLHNQKVTNSSSSCMLQAVRSSTASATTLLGIA